MVARILKTGALIVIHLVTVGASTPKKERITFHRNVSYCEADKLKLEADIAIPAEGNKNPAVVFIHGGGWSLGSRKSYESIIRSYAANGFVGVSVDYRLATFPFEKDRTPDKYQVGAKYPAQVEDVKCAIRWLRAHADKYQIDTDNIGVMGRSAGGHLALMVGVTDKEFDNGQFSNYSSRVQAVANWYGTTDFKRRYFATFGNIKTIQNIIERFLGSAPEKSEDLYKEASPINYLSNEDPEVLTLHGTHDKIVPFSQAQEFHKQMEEKGMKHTLLILDKQGHGFREKQSKWASKKALRFFERTLR